VLNLDPILFSDGDCRRETAGKAERAKDSNAETSVCGFLSTA
jgi:hypothetical protein